ncbi:hypothetical protein [Endozoicomonas numazuensis]|uniref:USP domain-containing protein n=1 Tax=Endozoicomonas numazuensis TaxID=1137799 RepID=A0A081NDA0_9GAMM|nr:hypothetical protein [Endozoicomonas numazuensis]KEQ16423.1 hypothetical protein GZ78_21395 [Endozoicomonas numazuensis]
MKPDELLGKDTWSALQTGAELSGVSDRQFKTRKSGWLIWLLRIVSPVNWFGSGVGRKNVVKLIHLRVVEQCKDERLASLRMAAAGMVRIKSVALGGELVTAPFRTLDQKCVSRFFDLNNTPAALIQKIPDRTTRNRLRGLYFSELLASDMEKLSQITKVASSDPETKIRKPLRKLFGDSLYRAIENLAVEPQLSQCEARIRSSRAFPINAHQAVQQSLDQLLIRSHLARHGKVSVEELNFSFQHFLETLKRFPSVRTGLAREFLEKTNNGIAFMALVTAFRASGVQPRLPELPQTARMRQLSKDSYRAELEAPEQSPGLQNLGNKCYYNSMIKLLSHQFSMADLEVMDSRVRPVAIEEKGDSAGVLRQRQELYTSLITLLRSIKLCRAGFVPDHEVNEINRLFIQQLSRCQQDRLISPLFSGATQEDAHEFTQVVNKILNPMTNPRLSYSSQVRKVLTLNDKRYEGVVGKNRDNVIFAEVQEGGNTHFRDCLKLQPEERNYFWEPGDEKDVGLKKENILAYQKQHARTMIEKLETFKVEVNRGYDPDFAAEVQAMVFNAETGYFERSQKLDENGLPKKVILPPWVKTTFEPVYEASGRSLETVMMMPKIFKHGAGGSRKLADEGKAFFESCLEGVDVPFSTKKNRTQTMNMDVVGISCHQGGWYGGHYVYIEKTSRGWLLHNDSQVRTIGNDEALKHFLGNRFTPYVYHLKRKARTTPTQLNSLRR